MLPMAIALAMGAAWTGMMAAFFYRRARRSAFESVVMARINAGDEHAVAPLLRANEARSPLAEKLEDADLIWSPLGFVTRIMVVATILLLIGSAVGGTAFGLLLSALSPIYYGYRLMRGRQKRIEKINEQMPRVLDMMVLTLRAGHSLPQSVAFVAREIPAPAGRELARVSEEHELGRPLEEAFIAMSRRLSDCDAVRTLVVSVLVLRQTGGNLIEVLDRLIQTLRSQQQYRMRLRVVTAEGRMSATILALLPMLFAAGAMALDPSYMRLLSDDPFGRMLLVVCGCLWIVGVFWVRRMVRSRA